MSMATGLAPRCFSTITAASPIGPTPITSTVSPGRRPSLVMPCQATPTPQPPTAIAVSNVISSGIGRQRRQNAAILSAWPKGFQCRPRLARCGQ
jgi:hypothetical protein